MLEKIFHLSENGTTVRRELVAGLTTFLTMSYILAVNPMILSAAGAPREGVFLATALSAGLTTLGMAFWTNTPIALAPGMGLNAYFAAVVLTSGGRITWQTALGAVFLSGLLFLVLTLAGIRPLLVRAVPNSLKRGIVAGIGLFLAIIGAKTSGIMAMHLESVAGPGAIASPAWFLAAGNLSQPGVLLALLGLALAAVLQSRRVPGAYLISIFVITILGFWTGITDVSMVQGNLVFIPSVSQFIVGSMDVRGAFELGVLGVVFTFTFVELFDTFGTLIGVLGRAGVLDHASGHRIVGRAMTVDAIGVSLGAALGTSTVTSYIESAAGMAQGGRTGLTSVTTGLLLLLSVFLGGIFLSVPAAATGPILILVGLFMLSEIQKVDFDSFDEALPAFLATILMPFTYNIATGIAAGIVSYVLLKLARGRVRDVHWLMWVLSALVVVRYAWMGAH